MSVFVCVCACCRGREAVDVRIHTRNHTCTRALTPPPNPTQNTYVPERPPEHARVRRVLPDAVERGDGEREELEALLLEGVVAVEEQEVQGVGRPVLRGWGGRGLGLCVVVCAYDISPNGTAQSINTKHGPPHPRPAQTQKNEKARTWRSWGRGAGC